MPLGRWTSRSAEGGLGVLVGRGGPGSGKPRATWAAHSTCSTRHSPRSTGQHRPADGVSPAGRGGERVAGTVDARPRRAPGGCGPVRRSARRAPRRRGGLAWDRAADLLRERSVRREAGPRAFQPRGPFRVRGPCVPDPGEMCGAARRSMRPRGRPDNGLPCAAGRGEGPAGDRGRRPSGRSYASEALAGNAIIPYLERLLAEQRP
jgi:hypothetical protein